MVLGYLFVPAGVALPVAVGSALGPKTNMPEIIGIDHIYITVMDIERSEQFYDIVMGILGFRKSQFQMHGEKHIQ